MSIDEAWTARVLVPLFDFDRDPQQAIDCWSGFLWSQAWNDQILRLLAGSLPSAFHHLKDGLRCEREAMCRLIASAAMYSDSAAVVQDLLPDFIVAVEVEVRALWAGIVTRLLERTPRDVVQDCWRRWIREYWVRRNGGIPRVLDPAEIEQMANWVLLLGDAFGESVELLIASPTTFARTHGLLRRVRGNEAVLRDTRSAARLLEYVVSNSTTPFFDCSEVGEIVDDLAAGRDGETLEGLLRVCDAAASLQCAEALSWSEGIRSLLP
jgi:hypothetical protein